MGHSMLDQILANNFPQTGVALAFGYGSKVIKQNGWQSGSDLIDIIFCVDDSTEWHKENLARNKQHYSSLKHLSNNVEKIVKIQENYGAKIYFNPFVRIANLSIKYGIIKAEHLIDDLLHWSNLYVAGRLHKPVELFVNTSDQNESLRAAMQFNRESAIRAALLQLPETFEPLNLFKTITRLSYQGDIRMRFGEDKNKIDNIVTRQLEQFEQLYMPTLRMSHSFRDNVQWDETRQVFLQDTAPKCLLRNLRLLPKNLRNRICEIHGKSARTIECDVVLSSLSRDIDHHKVVERAITTIVRQSSLSQSLKGLLTAGFLKSLKYSQRKLLKSLVSRLNYST